METTPSGFSRMSPVVSSTLGSQGSTRTFLGPWVLSCPSPPSSYCSSTSLSRSVCPVESPSANASYSPRAAAFGRINGYTIDPNQELIAIGVTNTIGSVFGAYPATGSFSRSALKAKSGVRTPIAGIFTAVIIIVALYGLTDAFYWIPTGGLSAVIIHAVADLVTPPDQVFTFWRVSPLEFIIWLAAVLVTVFTNIENGIYTSVAASLVLLLLRITHPRGSLLGKVVVRDNAKGEDSERTVFVPLEKGTHNQRIQVVPPSPGIVIYRHEEVRSFVFLSISPSD